VKQSETVNLKKKSSLAQALGVIPVPQPSLLLTFYLSAAEEVAEAAKETMTTSSAEQAEVEAFAECLSPFQAAPVVTP
tara:strand:+ start:95 stop:328 length:234 start_codon:yes stop_codon:yes gene_type:complete